MALILDSSVLVRLANASDALHPTATRAVLELRRRGETLFITPQGPAEFWVVATRPVAVNGLGLSAVQAEARLGTLEALFPLLEDGPGMYAAWRDSVVGLGVVGKQAHDARLVAACRVHGAAGVVTFNVRHFARLAAFWPGIRVVDPATV